MVLFLVVFLDNDIFLLSHPFGYNCFFWASEWFQVYSSLRTYFESLSFFFHVIHQLGLSVMFFLLPYFASGCWFVRVPYPPTCWQNSLSLFWNVLFCLHCLTLSEYLLTLSYFANIFWFISSCWIVRLVFCFVLVFSSQHIFAWFFFCSPFAYCHSFFSYLSSLISHPIVFLFGSPEDRFCHWLVLLLYKLVRLVKWYLLVYLFIFFSFSVSTLILFQPWLLRETNVIFFQSWFSLSKLHFFLWLVLTFILWWWGV